MNATKCQVRFTDPSEGIGNVWLGGSGALYSGDTEESEDGYVNNGMKKTSRSKKHIYIYIYIGRTCLYIEVQIDLNHLFVHVFICLFMNMCFCLHAPIQTPWILPLNPKPPGFCRCLPCQRCATMRRTTATGSQASPGGTSLHEPKP